MASTIRCAIVAPKTVSLNVKARTMSSRMAVSKSFTSRRVQMGRASARFSVSAAADAETVDKVRKIIAAQLGMDDMAAITGDSKFADLGADSLDTVEIMMELEEEFSISLDEEGANKIATVQEAADLISLEIAK